jgi:hypothetical protein
MKGLTFFLKTLKGEGQTALLTGCLAFAISMLLAPGAVAAAVAFGLVAAVVAAALDTFYFHLLFLLREAPAHAAEKRYHHAIEDAQHRLTDGSIRLKEALIRRFEADYQRSIAATRLEGRSRRQLREAKRRLRERAWAIQHVIPGDQLAEATAEARTDPALLDKWTLLVDGLVDARMQVQRRQGLFSGWASRFQPSHLARQTLAEWQGFSKAS